MSEITTDEHNRQPATSAPVIVGVDDSSTAIRAAQWAAVVADARKAPLQLVHVAERDATVSASGQILDNARRAVLERWARTSSAPAPAISTVALSGDPATRLLGLSTRACEIVVGSGCRATITRSMLGSVATTLAAASNCPLAVIRPPTSAAAAVGPVLVVVTATDSAVSPALSAAMRAAAERHCEVLVVTVTRPTARVATPRLEDHVEALLAEHERDFPTVRTRLVTYFGHARTAIEKFSATAQLVVTTRQRRQFWPLLSGATYSALQHTRCAVLVVPEQPSNPTTMERFRFRLSNRDLAAEQTID
ncbi:universal stress protein [Nocardia ignorata]|uniref:universal stress protein n=1 Tax=Nocardia ignorata TaxID=145285 RepID=UPI0036385DA9